MNAFAILLVALLLATAAPAMSQVRTVTRVRMAPAQAPDVAPAAPKQGIIVQGALQSRPAQSDPTNVQSGLRTRPGESVGPSRTIRSPRTADLG